MFDAISVSERTQKPWTVVVSFIGQLGLIGLGILAPLIGTGALPYRSWVSLPEPPRALKPRPATHSGSAKPTRTIPSQLTPRGVILPVRVPEKAVIIRDLAPMLSEGDGVGTPGGFGYSEGPGNSVIDSLLAQRPTPAPTPAAAPKPAAAPAPIKRIRQGGLVEEGKLLSGPRPAYPPIAIQARIEGTVLLEAVIARDGTVMNLRAISGPPMLIPAALAAVRRWVFRPTSLNGEPVEVATEIQVRFTLQQR